MKLKELCEEKNITQEKLAEDLDVNVRTIRRWESSTPTARIILKLANYFDVFPYELLEENENMPELQIGKSGSINFAYIKKEVLLSINNLSSENIVCDIYRGTYITYTDKMLEELLNISLEITNIYSRLVFLLNSKDWINLLHRKINNSNDDYSLQLKLLAIDLFYPNEGLFNNREITKTMENMCLICNKYKFNPLYNIYLPSYIKGLLINFYILYNAGTTTQLHQKIVCEQVLLELLNFVGDNNVDRHTT